jgi:hypothetical protein
MHLMQAEAGFYLAAEFGENGLNLVGFAGTVGKMNPKDPDIFCVHKNNCLNVNS